MIDTFMVTVYKIDNERDFEKALQIREKVFVKEQSVPKEDEYDEFDKTAIHFIAADDKGQAYGTARWRKTANGIKLERFAVKKEFRGRGIGAMLLESILEDIQIQRKDHTSTAIYLHAQIAAFPFYKKFGFAKEGDAFEECGIKHYRMSRNLGGGN